MMAEPLLGQPPSDAAGRISYYSSEIGNRLDRFDELVRNPISKRIDAIKSRLTKFDGFMGVPSPEGSGGVPDEGVGVPPSPAPSDGQPPEPHAAPPGCISVPVGQPVPVGYMCCLNITDNYMHCWPIGQPAPPGCCGGPVEPPPTIPGGGGNDTLPLPIGCEPGDSYKPPIPGLCRPGHYWDAESGLCICGIPPPDTLPGGPNPDAANKCCDALDKLSKAIKCKGTPPPPPSPGEGGRPLTCLAGFHIVICDGVPTCVADLGGSCGEIEQPQYPVFIGPPKPGTGGNGQTTLPSGSAEDCCLDVCDHRPAGPLTECEGVVSDFPRKGDDRVQFFCQVPFHYVAGQQKALSPGDGSGGGSSGVCESYEEDDCEIGEYEEDLSYLQCPNDGVVLSCQ